MPNNSICIQDKRMNRSYINAHGDMVENLSTSWTYEVLQVESTHSTRTGFFSSRHFNEWRCHLNWDKKPWKASRGRYPRTSRWRSTDDLSFCHQQHSKMWFQLKIFRAAKCDMYLSWMYLCGRDGTQVVPMGPSPLHSQGGCWLQLHLLFCSLIFILGNSEPLHEPLNRLQLEGLKWYQNRRSSLWNHKVKMSLFYPIFINVMLFAWRNDIGCIRDCTFKKD